MVTGPSLISSICISAPNFPERISFFNANDVIFKKKRNILFRFFFPKKHDYFPDVENISKIKSKINQVSPDYILTIWDEFATEIISGLNFKKIAYYGNPPPKNYNIALMNNLKGKNFFLFFFLKIMYSFYLNKFKKFHFESISKIDHLFNVSKLDANYYQKNGIKCEYINNIYKNTYNIQKIKKVKKKIEKEKLLKITGNVGNLNGTANSLGLEYLFNELIPELKKFDFKFEIHIFGSGKLKNNLSYKISKIKEIRIRGFVKNIDSEICSSHIFLCCNNATKYNVGHTRYLHAFSLGTCVVAHKNVSEVMPELANFENCFLGKSPREIAKIIFNLNKKRKLLEKIGNKGFACLKNEFSVKKAVNTITKNLR